MSAQNKKSGLLGRILLVAFCAVLFVAVYVLVRVFVPGSETPAEAEVPLVLAKTDYSAAQALLKAENNAITEISDISFISTNPTENATAGGLVSFTALLHGFDQGGIERYELRSDVTIKESADIALRTKSCCAILDTGISPRTVNITVSFGENSRTFTYNVKKQRAQNDNIAILLNPFTGVSEDYAPVEVREVGNRRIDSRAADDLSAMFEAAKAAGFSMSCNSCYRDYAKQQVLYNYAVRTLGENQTDTAPPGNSEHQSGLAADITWSGMNGGLSADMEFMDEYFWLAEHCWEYGFVLRYEDKQTAKTGYMFEPWHYRYIGRELAKLYHEGGWHTLDEFLCIPR